MPQISRVRYEFKDDYEHIRVIDVFPENHRYLHFEDSVQGVLDLSAHHMPVLEYIGLMAEGGRAFNVLPSAVLLGGLGSCGLLHVVNHWWHRRARITSVEYSFRIHDIARRFFRLRSRDEVVLGDFRATLEEEEYGPLDLIFLDCYTALSIPPHLTTWQFMNLLKDNLSEEGACCFNLWSPACNELCGDQLRTMMEVFGKVAVASCREDQNFVVFVRRDPEASWPTRIHFKERRYDLRLYSLSQPDYWPDYVRDGEIIRDENMGEFFDAVGMML